MTAPFGRPRPLPQGGPVPPVPQGRSSSPACRPVPSRCRPLGVPSRPCRRPRVRDGERLPSRAAGRPAGGPVPRAGRAGRDGTATRRRAAPTGRPAAPSRSRRQGGACGPCRPPSRPAGAALRRAPPQASPSRPVPYPGPAVPSRRTLGLPSRPAAGGACRERDKGARTGRPGRGAPAVPRPVPPQAGRQALPQLAAGPLSRRACGTAGASTGGTGRGLRPRCRPAAPAASAAAAAP